MHIEAWERSGLSQRRYRRTHRLTDPAFARWLRAIADAEVARIRTQNARILAETEREERRKHRKWAPVSSCPKTNATRRVQTFWAMYVETANWNGLTVRQYAGANLSKHSLRRWRDLIESGEVASDWCGRLHPSARLKMSSGVSSAAMDLSVETELTGRPTAGPPYGRTDAASEQQRAHPVRLLRRTTGKAGVGRRGRDGDDERRGYQRRCARAVGSYPGSRRQSCGQPVRRAPCVRQAQLCARPGFELERSTLASWVGGACWWLEALDDRLRKDLFASDQLFADDTPVPAPDPGRGRTKTGRLWVYARDQRPWGEPAPPADLHLRAGRKAERPVAHLEHFKGVLHVAGYACFERLTTRGDVVLAACWARTARKFYEVVETADTPLAHEALRRIAGRCAVEAQVRGQSSAHRLAARRSLAKPIVGRSAEVTGNTSRICLAAESCRGVRYALARWNGLTRFLDDGRIELDTNMQPAVLLRSIARAARMASISSPVGAHRPQRRTAVLKALEGASLR